MYEGTVENDELVPEQIMISYVPLKPYSQLWDIYSEAFDGFDAEIETETQEDYEYNMEER